MKLEELLEEYKSLTLTLIEKSKNDESLIADIHRRNDVLKELKKLNLNEDEVKKILEELNIPNLENELILTIKKEMVNIKKKIENIRSARQARKIYGKTTQIQYNLFHKRI